MQNSGNRKPAEFSRNHYISDEAEARAFIMGTVVCELIDSGNVISRKSVCCKLLARLEHCESPEEEHLYFRMIRSLFGRH